MGDVIKVLKDTPIPTILIWAGLFFLLLAFVSKLGGVIEVQPNQKRSAIFIGLLLLTIGLALNITPTFLSISQPTPFPSLEPNPSSTSPKPVESSLQDTCSSILREGNILNWKIRNYRKLGNIGTLEIKNVDSVTGGWIGDQITENKDDIKIRVTGTFSSSTMSLIHPNGAERWFGNCRSGKIEGSIETTYASQLTFEMYQ
jgi:hypothetical protein